MKMKGEDRGGLTIRRAGAIVCSVVLLTRCASIAHGTHQDVPVSSNPTGANVAVSCGSSKQPANPITPTVVALKRNANPCSVTVSKEGYESASVAFTRKVTGWFFANILIGGVLGMIIDGADGAIYNVSPDTATVSLQRQMVNGQFVTVPPPQAPEVSPGEEVVSADLCPAEKRLQDLPGYKIITIKKVKLDGSVSIYQKYVRP